MADPPLRVPGLHQPYALRNIVEIESVDGITGIAETYGGESPRTALEKLREQILGANALRLLGDLQPLVHGEGGGSERSQVNLVPGENPLDTSARTYAAIETACLDLVGKSVGKPVCDLIGGRVREKVSFSAYLFYKHAGGGGEGEDARKDEYGECLTPESMVRQTQQMVQQYGFKSIKLKAGVLDPDQEIETIRQLRQEFGSDFPLRIDPNSAWKLETSLEVGRALKRTLQRWLSGGSRRGIGQSCYAASNYFRKNRHPNASNVASILCSPSRNVRKDTVQVMLATITIGGCASTTSWENLSGFWHGIIHALDSHLGVSLIIMSHVAATTLTSLTIVIPTTHDPQDEIVEGGPPHCRWFC